VEPLAFAAPAAYRAAVRSLTRPLAFLYIVVQLLLAMPAGAVASPGAAQTPCEHMAGAPAGDHCPCCPDGVSSMKDCLASCTLAATVSVSLPLVPVAPARSQSLPAAASATPCTAEPPLKPPPIA
jgi:hypothetical protein